MKKIKINFTDFWEDYDKENNIITRLLRERYDVEITDQPEYLIYGCFDFTHLAFDGVKIFYTGEDISPDFNFCDYALGFDRITFGDRYFRFPNFLSRTDDLAAAEQKHLFTEEDLARKTKFCNFVYSNSRASKIRTEFFESLSQYKPVDSGGRILNNIGGPVENKIEFQKDYKFTIAFENDSSPDYTTEKLLDAFAAKTIPIYWGNPNVAMDFNPKSFINCHEYDSFDAVIERVKEIDSDPDLYRAILAEPIFAGGERPQALTLEAFRAFLYHIFDQPIEEAHRRSRYSWKLQHAELMQDMFACYRDPWARVGYALHKKCKKK